MNTLYILLIVANYDANNFTAQTAPEFYTREKCEIAKTYLLKHSKYKKYLSAKCVKK